MWGWEYSQWWIKHLGRRSRRPLPVVHLDILQNKKGSMVQVQQWGEFQRQKGWAVHSLPYSEQLWLIMAPRRALNSFGGSTISHSDILKAWPQPAEGSYPRPVAVSTWINATLQWMSFILILSATVGTQLSARISLQSELGWAVNT